MSTRTDSTGFMRPDNEKILDSLSQENKNYYTQLREAGAKAAQEHPGMDTRVITAFLHDYLIMAKNDDTQRAKDVAFYEKGGKPVDHRAIRQASQKRRDDFLQDFQSNKLPQYRTNGQQAWQAFGKQVQGPSIFTAAINQFYNPEKQSGINFGGVQVGGILGAVVGGLLASQIFGGLEGIMEGGAFGIVGTLLAVFAGAWLGNRTADTVTGFFKKDDKEPPAPGKTPGVTAPEKDQAKGPEKEPEKNPSMTEEARRQAAFEEHLRSLGVSPAQDVINHDGGHPLPTSTFSMPPKTVPKGPAPKK